MSRKRAEILVTQSLGPINDPDPGSGPRRPWDAVELLDEGATMPMSHR